MSTHHRIPVPTRKPQVFVNPLTHFNESCIGEVAEFGSDEWFTSFAVALFCITINSLGSGLTMGLLATDELTLNVIYETRLQDCRTKEQREELRNTKLRSRSIIPLTHRHHLLIVTLLLTDATASEILPLALGNMVPEWVAVILSVSFILIFVEILPSAIFTGPNQMKLGAMFTPLVWFLLYVFFVLAYPISKILDCIMGHEEVDGYGYAELKAVVRMHGPKTEEDESTHTDSTTIERIRLNAISNNEAHALSGVLDLTARKVGSHMTPISQIAYVDSTDVITDALLFKLEAQGGSHMQTLVVNHNDPNFVCGILDRKRLVNPAVLGTTVKSIMPPRPPLFIAVNTDLLACLTMMQHHGHMVAVVVNDVDRATETWCSRHTLQQGGDGSDPLVVLGWITKSCIVRAMFSMQSPASPLIRDEGTVSSVGYDETPAVDQVNAFDMPHIRLWKKVMKTCFGSTQRTQNIRSTHSYSSSSAHQSGGKKHFSPQVQATAEMTTLTTFEDQ